MPARADADDSKAAALIEKQIRDGERILSAEPRDRKPRLSPAAFADAQKFFAVNQMGRGTRPGNATDNDAIKEMMEAGVLKREGHARGTAYTLQFRPNDIVLDASLAASRKTKPRGRSVGASPAPARSGVLTIGASEKAILRKGIREYLAFATSAQARKHEEKRQSENILDIVNARAKEILKASQGGNGPRLTPMDAMRHAQAEVGMDFETLLKMRFDPLFFEIFGILELPDTSMRTLRA